MTNPNVHFPASYSDPQKPAMYVLTGSPGSGKSSIIKALDDLGEYTVAETATRIIREKGEDGKEWAQHNGALLDEAIALRQPHEEQKALSASPTPTRVFTDRSIVDPVAYSVHFSNNPAWTPAARVPGTDRFHNAVLAHLGGQLTWHHKSPYQRMVFITKELPEGVGHMQNGIRYEDNSLAKLLGLVVRKMYSRLGYTLIEVPALCSRQHTLLSPEERAAYIIRTVSASETREVCA